MTRFAALSILSKFFDLKDTVFSSVPNDALSDWASTIPTNNTAKVPVLENWQHRLLINGDQLRVNGPTVNADATYTGRLTPEQKNVVVNHQFRYQFARAKRLMTNHKAGKHQHHTLKCLLCRRDMMAV